MPHSGLLNRSGRKLAATLLRRRQFEAGVWPRRATPILGVLMAAACCVSAAQPPPLQTAEEVLRLTRDERKQGHPVHIRGTVTEHNNLTFRGTEYPSLYVQDSTGGIYIDPDPRRWKLKLGDLVEVTGITGEKEGGAAIHSPELKVTGAGPLPSAKPSSFAGLLSGRSWGQFVEVHGTIGLIYGEHNWVTMDLVTEGGVVEVLFSELSKDRNRTPLRVTARSRRQGPGRARDVAGREFAASFARPGKPARVRDCGTRGQWNRCVTPDDAHRPVERFAKRRPLGRSRND